jgi:hypothetical protein
MAVTWPPAAIEQVLLLSLRDHRKAFLGFIATISCLRRHYATAFHENNLLKWVSASAALPAAELRNSFGRLLRSCHVHLRQAITVWREHRLMNGD